MILPSNTASEEAVIGGVFYKPEYLEDLIGVVDVDDFYTETHRAVWLAILAVFGRVGALDIVAVRNEAIARKADKVAVDGVLWKVTAEDVPWTHDVVREHAATVAALAKARRLATACVETTCAITGGNLDPAKVGQVVEAHDAAIFALRARETAGGPLHSKEVLGTALDVLEVRMRGGKLGGYPTGLGEFDKAIVNLRPGKMSVIAGPPSHGKTAFMSQAAIYLARHETPAAFFTAEDDKHQWMFRALSHLSQINGERITGGNISDEQFNEVFDAGDMLSKMPLWIDDSAGMTPAYIRAKTRQLVKKSAVKVIFVDYLQYLTAPHGRYAGDTERFNAILDQLKEIPKELGVHLCLGSQMNRDIEKRPKNNPQLSDLRGSGMIEAFANMITVVTRPCRWPGSTAAPDEAKFFILKNKDARCGVVDCKFDGSTLTFHSDRIISQY